MKVITTIIVIWTLTEAIASAEYRFKRRGPAPPQRPPPAPGPPAYLKKWQLARPHRGVSRPPRPIPVHNQPQNYGKVPLPIGPVKTNYQALNRIHQKPLKSLPRKPTVKPFQSSRPLNFQPELDYHIQTNNIPNAIPIQNKVADIANQIPIKQLDEKGPIHTIPAPNLSRDKPSYHSDDTFKERRHYQEHHRPDVIQQQQQQQQQKFHQYQVTESSEQLSKYNIPQKTYTESFQTINNFRNQYQQPQYVQPPPQYVATNTYDNIPVEHTLALPSNNLPNNKEIQQYLNEFNNQQEQFVKTPIQNTKDLQQLVASYQTHDHSQVHNQPSEEYKHEYRAQPPKNPQQPQPHLQLNIPDYETMLKQAQLFQSEPAYLSQVQQAIGQNANEQSKPQLHTFNYEEQFSKNPNQYEGSSVKFPDFETDTNTPTNAHSFRNNLNVNQQNAYLQHLLDSPNTNNENTNGGNQKKRSDTSSSVASDRNDNDKEQISNFYMTLPNKEAAEALASLQEAGKINSNLMHLKSQDIQSLQLRPKNPLTIYVSDEDSSEMNEEETFQRSSDDGNHLEGKNDEDISEENDEVAEDNKNFGNKIKPKKKRN
ncbi:GATA zinc finger domain-containing protein 10-like [Agrilus planipennis]|uniref:GATA zinc finger domain-containing protein 10-like n=1 Tax=Agrilus planipennis TaxID=224129 RepID=A0A1W4X1W5_AGRPL|nr:GATA zinc finger domain-containing protein 10-like [Agrilus planipennis]